MAATARPAVQRAATAGPGVIRTAVGLASAATRLQHLADTRSVAGEPGSGAAGTAEWETTNLLQVATALTQVAALREETRGGHYREDFPNSDDAWRGRLVSHLDPDGVLVTRFVPLRPAPQESR